MGTVSASTESTMSLERWPSPFPITCGDHNRQRPATEQPRNTDEKRARTGVCVHQNRVP
ncbi:hypothetical protein [Natronorubrum aibiense]|uniref:hypothetical protein n=1 Tax=Natronorubrum aibiense TaxID=348826 RepID=UPI001456B154|nr:hypothetical protein [Natronorubrum aibiense]